MNPRDTKETKNRKALDEMIEQITVCTFGDNERDESILRVTP